MKATTTDWRLVAIAVIATVYTIAWRGIAFEPPRPAQMTEAPRARAPVPVRATRPLRVRTRSS